MSDVPGLFADVDTIQLIDWPHQEVPGTLLRAGFAVFGHEPSGYHRHAIAPEAPAEGRSFPVAGGWLTAEAIDEAPPADIVCTFRPPEEQPDIARMAIAAGAKVLWVQQPAEPSLEAQVIAEAAGLAFVHGVGIEAIVSEFKLGPTT